MAKQKSIAKSLLLLCAGALIYTIFFQTFYYWMRYFTPWPYTGLSQFVICLTYNYLPTLFLMVASWLVVFRIPYHTGSKIGHWVRNITILTVLMIVSNFIFYFCTHEFVDWGGTCFNTLMIWIFSEWFYYSNQYRIAYENLQNQKAEVETLRYDLYKSKINPHFLFNSLAILHSFIKTRSESAERFTILLSRFYQSTLQHIDMVKAPLSRELKVLNHYCELLKVLYGQNLTINIEIDPEVDTDRISTVAMGIQLMVENVVRHNEISSKHTTAIDVHITQRETIISNTIHLKSSIVSSTRWSHQYLQHICDTYNKSFRAGAIGHNMYRVYIPHLTIEQQ